MKLPDLRVECCELNCELGRSGLVDITFGNLSVIDRAAGIFAIKPSGVSYDALKPEDIVLVDLDGDIVDSSLRPSSDTPTHRCLFQHFPEAAAVVHTHSRTAVAFAQAGREIPLLGTTHADYFRGPVPVTRAMTPEEISADYEWQTGKVICELFEQISPLDVPAVLVRNHGPFAWGKSGSYALETALALEIIAQMAAQALALNPEAPSPSSALSEKHFLRKHGSGAYYGQK